MIQFTHAEQTTVLGQMQLFCRYKAVQKHATDTIHLRVSIADLISRFQGSLARENSEKGAHPEQQKHFRSMAVQEPPPDSVHSVPHWMGRFARRVNKCSTLTFHVCRQDSVSNVELSHFLGRKSAHSVFAHPVYTCRTFSKVHNQARTRSEIGHTPTTD